MSRTINFGAPCFAVLFLLVCSLAARAQESGTQPSSPQAQGGIHHSKRGGRLEWLSEELNLTDDQKAKVKPILEDEAIQTRAALEDTSLSQQKKNAKMDQIHDTANSKIHAILTSDQQKKFAKLNEQQKAHREEAKLDESKQPQNGSKGANNGSIAVRVKQIIVEQLGVDEAEVTPNASFKEDFGADDLDDVELVMAFEEAFGIEISDEDFEKFFITVKGATDSISSHVKTPPASTHP